MDSKCRSAEVSHRSVDLLQSVVGFLREVLFVRIVRVHAAQRQVPGGGFGHAQIRQRLGVSSRVSAQKIDFVNVLDLLDDDL